MTAIGQIIALGAVFFLLGCGSTPRLEGTYVGRRELNAQPGADPDVIHTLSKVEVRIDDKGRFVLFESGLPKTGEVGYSGSKAILHIREIAGNPVENLKEPVSNKELEPQENGDVLYRDPDLEEEPVRLVKSQPTP